MVFCNEIQFNKLSVDESHNPYFNRWFSAITARVIDGLITGRSQSLF